MNHVLSKTFKFFLITILAIYLVLFVSIWRGVVSTGGFSETSPLSLLIILFFILIFLSIIGVHKEKKWYLIPGITSFALLSVSDISDFDGVGFRTVIDVLPLILLIIAFWILHKADKKSIVK